MQTTPTGEDIVIDLYNQIPSDSSPESDDGKGKKKNSSNGWNDQNNKLAIIWMMRCAWMEKNLYRKLKKFTYVWTVILFVQICVNAVASALSLLNLGAQEYLYQNYGVSVTATMAVLNVVGTIIASLIAALEFPKIMEQLRYGITKFSKLIRTIEQIVNTKAKRRPDADDFLQTISDKYYKYHTSGKFLVEEMLNFYKIRDRVNQASDFNQIKPPETDMYCADEEIIETGEIGLLKNFMKRVSPNDSPEREEEELERKTKELKKRKTSRKIDSVKKKESKKEVQLPSETFSSPVDDKNFSPSVETFHSVIQVSDFMKDKKREDIEEEKHGDE